jgi:hypothetical protein
MPWWQGPQAYTNNLERSQCQKISSHLYWGDRNKSCGSITYTVNSLFSSVFPHIPLQSPGLSVHTKSGSRKLRRPLARCAGWCRLESEGEYSSRLTTGSHEHHNLHHSWYIFLSHKYNVREFTNYTFSSRPRLAASVEQDCLCFYPSVCYIYMAIPQYKWYRKYNISCHLLKVTMIPRGRS